MHTTARTGRIVIRRRARDGRPRRRLAAGAAILALAAPAAPGIVAAGGSEPEDRSANVQVVGHHPYLGGSELDADGQIIFAGQLNGRTDRGELPDQGGIWIFDDTGGDLAHVATIECEGYDNYVRVVRPGLIAVAHHQGPCNPTTRARGNGMFLADVSDPANPHLIDGVQAPSAHTLSVHPSGDYVYVNPGGLANGNGDSLLVDVRDLDNIETAVFRPSRIGCHDLGFHPTAPIAYCAGLGETQIWDVSDPMAPETIGRIVNPAIQFAHNAVVSPDGTRLVINDEAFVLHECETGASAFGALWIYDITIPELPVLAGRIDPPASRSTVGNIVGWSDSWCTAHNYNFIPDTSIVVSSWFTGGTTIHDISNPLQPERLAWYKPEDTIAYTAHWFEGRVYINDNNRGLEVLEVAGLPLDGSPAAEAAYAAAPRVDRTAELVPEDLLAARGVSIPGRMVPWSGFCSVPPPPAATGAA